MDINLLTGEIMFFSGEVGKNERKENTASLPVT